MGAKSSRAARMQYKLPVGERFRIVTRARTLLKAELPGPMHVNLLRQEGGFTAACVVLSNHNGWTRIRCTLEDVSGEAEMLGRGMAYRAADGPAPRFLPAVEGETFVVEKSLWGELKNAEGSPGLQKVLGGIPLTAALLWFGTHFPRQAVSPGARWEYDDAMTLQWPFVPLVIPQPTRFHYAASFRRWVRFSGQECPEVVQRITAEPEPGQVRLYTASGEGRGRVIFEPEFGKIARSEKQLRLDLRPVVGGGGTWRVEIQSSSWHE